MSRQTAHENATATAPARDVAGILATLAAAAFLAYAFLPLTGCAMTLSVPGERMPPTDMDIAELAPGSLRLPVTDYKWSYTPGNTHVRVQGTVFNDTGAPVQGARISGVLHDQNGTPVAYGSSFVAPSYLADGAKGQFEFVALVKRESGITFTRLVVSSRVSSY